ncbi:MBL fold metallo-hydrolase, partial [Pseudomonas sp. MPR-AND1A]|uniref:MBL fold metallo-hydrolase n=3 Tax=Pseudomonadota TaxID=1224 RepID=UPI000CBBB3CF
MQREEIEAFGEKHGFDLTAAVRWLDAEDARVPKVKAWFDPRTSSVQYIVTDPATNHCVIIDPVLDFDEKSGATGTMNADAILAYVAREGLTVDWILDTHPHADHFSAAQYLKGKTGAPTATGAHVTDVQTLWN